MKSFVVVLKEVPLDIFHFLIMNVMYDFSERLDRADGPNRAGFVILLVHQDGGTTFRKVVCVKYIFHKGQCAT